MHLLHTLFVENNEGTPMSFFHDVPLQPSENVFNMVVEIPRWDNAKLEVCTCFCAENSALPLHISRFYSNASSLKIDNQGGGHESY